MSKQITLALVMLAFAGTVRAQSLADVAKKEEERRKASPPPTKVYTNKDLVDVPGSTPPPPASPSDTAAAADSSAASGSTGAGKIDDDKSTPKDKAYWTKRLKALQDKLDNDTAFASALQSQVNALTTDFVNRDDPAQRAVIEAQRVKALGQLNDLKTTIPLDNKAIADLLEEARRAGVPPGWLR
ncbi:MAG TPA: hypothetical protein VGG73_05465 [Vicinamibacterales bacterium]|jgi:hypothetical protein